MRILSLNPNLGTFARRSAQLCLMLALVATLAGCSWFRKGEKNVTPPSETPVVEAPQSGPSDGLPVDQPTDNERPTVLIPIPDMQIIYFDTDKYQIRSSELGKMESNLAFLKANPDMKVYIVGHCDERDTIEYNFNLGTNRANAIRDYFVQNGVELSLLSTLSKGEEEPAVVGHDESAWSKNRRVEFKQMQ